MLFLYSVIRIGSKHFLSFNCYTVLFKMVSLQGRMVRQWMFIRNSFLLFKTYLNYIKYGKLFLLQFDEIFFSCWKQNFNNSRGKRNLIILIFYFNQQYYIFIIVSFNINNYKQFQVTCIHTHNAYLRFETLFFYFKYTTLTNFLAKTTLWDIP